MSECITINGKPVVLTETDMPMSLLSFLRERLFLNGVKNGCDQGLCGTCTVVVDDRAVRACKQSVGKLVGKNVITIEGMEYPDGRLHPIQQAYVDAGAIQCGFCIPGMVLATYALLVANPEPSRDDIRKALRGNLCRCTGYQHIIDAVELAARTIREQGLSVLAGCLVQ